MRKLYTTLSVALAALTASATAPVLINASDASLPQFKNMERVTVQNSPAESRASQVKLADQQVGSFKSPAKLNPNGGWTSLGEGTWVEGPLDCFSDIPAGSTWKVEVFESDATPGLYRTIPYCEGSFVANLMEVADNHYMYFHAEDPNKVYTTGDNNEMDVVFYGVETFSISQCCPEGGWEGYNVYGTLADKVITFPANSHARFTGSSYTQTNRNGKFALYLPGADVKDYSFETAFTTCNDDETILFMAKVGKDIAAVKALIMPGTYSGTAGNYNIVAANGQTVPAGQVIKYNDDKSADEGVYTVFLVGVDANGAVKDGVAHWFHIFNENPDAWETVGTAKFTDPLIVSGQYIKAEQIQTLDVTVERNKADNNKLRLVNPMTPYDALFTEPVSITHNTHKHYIHFDITDPDSVAVAISPVGFDGGYGDMTVWGVTDRYSGNSKAELAQYGFKWVTYNPVTNVIALPEGSLFFGEAFYNKNQLFATEIDGKVELPAGAGVDNIAADNQAVEYYNLQGIRVENPTRGLYIRKQGGKATKVVL